MKAILDLLDKVPEPVLLVLNAFMGAFVLLAHGGALLLTFLKSMRMPPDQMSMIRTMAGFTLPMALLVLLGSAVALLRARWRRVILIGQGGILFASSLALLGWAASILIEGIPAGNFRWSPGLLTGWVSYGSYLCSRYCVPAMWQTERVRYMPIVAVVLALPVDLGILTRLFLRMSQL